MIPLVDLIHMMNEITHGLQEIDQEEEPSPQELKKNKMKKHAVADILNSSLEAIEKTEDTQEAVASLKAISITVLTPEGQTIISNALITVAAQMEGHQASGETDMTEQVKLATAIAQMAIAAAKKLEEKNKENSDPQKKKFAPKPKPDPALGILLLAHLLKSVPANDPRLSGLLKFLETLHAKLTNQSQQNGPYIPQNAPQHNTMSIQEQMKQQLMNRQNPQKSLNSQPNHHDLPSAFSTKIPKPGDPTPQ